MMRTKARSSQSLDGWDEWGIGCMVGWPGEESNGFHNVGTEQIEWLVENVWLVTICVLLQLNVCRRIARGASVQIN